MVRFIVLAIALGAVIGGGIVVALVLLDDFDRRPR